MLRLTITSLALTASVFAQESSELMTKLEGASNPFAPAVTVFDASGVSGVYNTLSKLTGTVFEGNGAGSIIMDGNPWRTGESRDIPVTGGKIGTLFVSLQPPEDDHPAIAVFKVVNNQQEISVDILGFNGFGLEAGTTIWGWQTGNSSVVTCGAAEKEMEGRSSTKRMVLRPSARSSSNKLTLLKNLSDTVPAWKAAPAEYNGEAIVFSPSLKPIRVPFSTLKQPPLEAVLGAAAVTPEGLLIGIIGAQGLVPARDLGVTSGEGVIPANSMDRLVFLKNR